METHVRQATPADADLLESAFSPAPPRSWLLAAPAGTREWAAFEDGEVRAWCAAPSRTVWMDGREVRFTELTDVVAREGGGELAHGDAWRQAAAATLGAEEDLVQYAFPTECSWEAGERFDGFDIVRTQHVLVQPATAPAERPPEVEIVSAFDHTFRWLWERCAGAFGASVIRDDALLRWRFSRASGRDYRVLATRDGNGVPRGYAVYSPAPWWTPGGAVLVDWLVPPEEVEVGKLLLRALRAEAQADGRSSLATTLVEWSPWFESFQRSGYAVHPSPLFLVARSAARRFDHLWLRDHWWVTLADTTLV